MNQEVKNLSDYPYTAIAHIITTFPDGFMAAGSGALVGRNDILTATHVVYSALNGGWATSIEVVLGGDYNWQTGRFENPSAVTLKNISWTIDGWPQETYNDRDHSTMNWNESGYDVALIGVSRPIGDQMGWFELDSGYNSTQWAHQIGYPGGAPGMMLGQAFVRHESGSSTYHADTVPGGEMMAAGSSGGPLFVYENGIAKLIGVKSAGTDDLGVWADIGHIYQPLLDLMAGNDHLLAGAGGADIDRPLDTFSSIVGTRKNDTLRGGEGDDLLQGLNGKDWLLGGAGNDRLEGGVGNDILHGGQGGDILIGGAGRDLYLWDFGDIEAGTADQLMDGKGSRLKFDGALLDHLKLNDVLLSEYPKKHPLGSAIDTYNGLAWADNRLLVDVNGDGVFRGQDDFSIDVIGVVNTVLFDARSDTLILA